MRPFGFHAAAFFVQYLNAFNKQKGELIMFIEKKKWAAGLLLALAVMITAFCLAVAGIMVLFALRRRYGMKTFLEIAAGAIARKRKGARS